MDLSEVKNLIEGAADKAEIIRQIRSICAECSDFKSQPIDNVLWVPIEKVTPNDYNPNSVAKKEMQLLYISIKEDGYTQPVVTIYDEQKDILERNHGMLPIVVINKTMNERMASTVRHNRARGSHAVTSMSKLVFEMLKNGWSDAEICKELGMEAEEINKLKYVTGFAKLFEKVKYNNAWKSEKQIEKEIEYKKAEKAKGAKVE